MTTAPSNTAPSNAAPSDAASLEPAALDPAPLDPAPLDPVLFDFPENLVWLQHCATGPIPQPAVEAIEHGARIEHRIWELSFRDHVVDLPATVRRRAARLIGGREEDVSLTATTTTGLALVAQGFPWSEGDEVVLPLGEFPSNYWPWRVLAKRGVEVREVPLWEGQRAGAQAGDTTPPPPDVDPEARLLDALGPRTRVLSVSWVRFQDGLRLDLARLAAGCRERGVELVVDGIQGAGTLALDVASLPGVSAFATGGHKGLLSVHGLGFLWTTPALRERLAPPGGWLSVEDADRFSRPSTDFDRGFLADGRALETGVPNFVGAGALAASLKVLLDAGVERIETHVLGLHRRLLDRLSATPARGDEAHRLRGLLERGRLSSILALHHVGSGAEGGMDHLEAGQRRNLHASVREGYLRLAFHGWHRAVDVDRVADWMAELAAAGGGD